MKKRLKFIFLSCVVLLTLTTFSVDVLYAYNYGEIGFPDEYGEQYSYKKECSRTVIKNEAETHFHATGWYHEYNGTTIICIYEKEAIGCYGGGVLQYPKICTPHNPC